MSATERLYHADSFLLRFTGTVIAHGAWQKKPSVLLDRTAFYPEAGGQMADRGTLAGAGVVDVQVDDEGRVHHVLDGELPAVGAEVTGEIDKDRRRVHMALHTGQHMLSRALADLAGAATVSSRLGESACTIDVDQEVVEERRIAASEDLVNSIVDDDVVVRSFFPTPEELASLPLRRRPTVSENIRVVAVGDFDVSPCGGTHCSRSAQVGLVHVTGVERYKGKIRVTFAAGARARRDLAAHAVTLRSLGRELSCDALLVPQGVSKLREELGGAREAQGKLRGRLGDAIATTLAAQAASGAPVVALIEDAGADLLRSIATRLTSEPSALAILGGRTSEGISVLVARGAGSSADCGALLKKLAAATGGRGGGRKEHAEGKLPPTADFDAAARAALAS
jgi:alanyl-tRNA synthetase